VAKNRLKLTDSPSPADGTVLGSTWYRDCEIIHTTDPRFIGNIDVYGFKPTSGFIVRDDMGDYVLPLPMQWFYTPYEAVAAIEMMEYAKPPSSPIFEYGIMQAYRRNWWMVFTTIEKILKTCVECRDLDENPREEIYDMLHLLRQNVASSRAKE
jgi:hypothetical protein